MSFCDPVPAGGDSEGGTTFISIAIPFGRINISPFYG